MTRNLKYVLVAPTRDEEAFLEQFLNSCVKQTIPPVELIVVNDGSTDRTGEIADSFASEYSWIHVVHREDRGNRKVGGGVVDAFYSGYEAIRNKDYAFIGKIDADVTLPPTYFETLMTKFKSDKNLGGASGKPWNPVGESQYEEFIIDEMVAGQVNFWRRSCFEEISGFVREVMWDGIVFHRARMFGWKTQSFRDKDLRILHHRLMGSSDINVYKGRLRWGRGQWFMGTHPLYIFASGAFRMRERPYVIGGICIVLGYFLAALKGMKRYDDLEFRKELRNWQLKRIGLKR